METVLVEEPPLTVVQSEVASGRQTEVGDQHLPSVGEQVGEV